MNRLSWFALPCLIFVATQAYAFGPYATTWSGAYPTSQSGQNVINGTGSTCALCHDDKNGGGTFNAYGWEIRKGTLSAVGVVACGAFALLLAAPPATPHAAESSSQRLALPCEVDPVSMQRTRKPASRGRPSVEALELEATPVEEQGVAVRRTADRDAGEVHASASRHGRQPSRAGARRAVGSEESAEDRIRTRVTGRVVDANGFPLSEVLVASLAPPLRATTNERGEFELKLDRSAGPENAGLVIQARREGYVTTERVVVSQKPEIEVELKLARRVEEAALTLCLVDDYGERVAQKRVFVTPVGSVDTFSSPTNQEGICRLSNFPPGPVVVWVRSSPEALPTLQRTVELQPGENHLDLRLP